MRHVARYLPAFLTLLIPLGILAFLGSRELRRQTDLAESFVRDGAFGFQAEAVATFQEALDRYCADYEAPLRDALKRGQPQLPNPETDDPDLLAVFVLDDGGRILHPRPRWPESPPLWSLSRSRDVEELRHLRIAQTFLIKGDRAGAIEHLEKLVAASKPGGSEPSDLSNRVRWVLQLAGFHRGAPAESEAHRILLDARDAVRGLPRPLDMPFSRMRMRAEPAALDLLCHAAAAELALDLHGERDELETLVREIGSGTYNVPAGLLSAILDRAVERSQDSTGFDAEETNARRKLSRLSEARGIVSAFTTASRASTRLSERVAATRAGERIYHVFDTGHATGLLALHRVAAEDRGRVSNAAWIGPALDLTSFTNRVLSEGGSDYLTPSDETGFYLDIRTSDTGARILRHPLPEGSSAAGVDIAPSLHPAGLFFHGIPWNAKRLLENREASARNQALLVLALCLLAGGGAFFLVRSVGRESELASMKVDLVSRVSHELRTPLAMIKLYGETLALGRTTDPEQSTRFASIISRESDRLTLMIDRILDFSRQQAGQITYHREVVDLCDLTEHVAEEYRPHVEAAGAELVADLDADLDGTLLVSVDRAAMGSALVNLLENAVKYAPVNAPDRRIEVWLRPLGPSAVLEVRDRGVGIPAGERKRIFESFYRASTSGESRGAGLGLSLVHHFAIAHGGNIVADSRDGGGTIFRLTLPLITDRSTPDGSTPTHE